jgi:hypothetical protein
MTEATQTETTLTLQGPQIGAVNVLIKGIQVAQQKGAFTLRDASRLQEALDLLVPPSEQAVEDDSSEESAA